MLSLTVGLEIWWLRIDLSRPCRVAARHPLCPLRPLSIRQLLAHEHEPRQQQHGSERRLDHHGKMGAWPAPGGRRCAGL